MVKGTIRLIKTWGSGTLSRDMAPDGDVGPHEGSLTAVLERAEHLAAMQESGLVGVDSRVFVPGASDDHEGPVVLGYEGSLSDPGGDVQIGPQFFMQTQDYGTSEYLSLIGATLVRVVDGSDFETFLEDADRARETGEFADFAAHPLTRICDAPSLGAPVPDRGPRLRVYVDAEGRVSTSPGGAVLGTVTDDLDTLETAWAKANAASAWPCAVSLAASVPEDLRVDGLSSRPWIGAYHSALAAIRDVRGRDMAPHDEIAVSGFGQVLDEELADEPRPDLERGDAPVVLWSGDSAFVHDPRSERTFQLGVPVARVVERVLVLGPHQAATGEHASHVAQVSEFFSSTGVSLVPE